MEKVAFVSRRRQGREPRTSRGREGATNTLPPSSLYPRFHFISPNSPLNISYILLCVFPLIKMYAHIGERFLFVLCKAVSLALGSGVWLA